MKTIQIDEDQVTTLEEVAKTLSEDYGWTKYVVEPNHIEFWAKDSEGKEVHGTVDSSGFAYDFDDPDEPLDEFEVDWTESFDGWSDIVWAYDADGRTVMLHN